MSSLVIAVHDGVSQPAPDEPVVDGKGRDHGKSKAAPKERTREARIHGARYDEHDGFIDDLHDGDRCCIRRKGEAKGGSERNLRAKQAAVPITMPSTSPMASPVRRCTVVRNAA